MLAIGFFNMLFATTELGTLLGSHYTAFEINLLMSVLFIYLLLSSDRTQGQSIYIATTKMIGTAFASVMSFLEFPSSPLLNFLYVAIFLCDATYTVLLYQKLAVQDLRPEQEISIVEN
jgi:predicted branched-subunit amino acid permease